MKHVLKFLGIYFICIGVAKLIYSAIEARREKDGTEQSV